MTSEEVKSKYRNAVYHFSVRWSLPKVERSESGIVAFRNRQPDVHELYREQFDKFIYQLECTGEANWHYQGYAHARTKCRADQLGLRLGSRLGTPVSVQEASNQGKERLKSYCMKTSSRRAGPWADHRIYLGADLPVKDSLYPWQLSLLELVQSYPDDRSIVWIVGEEGNQGKTKFCKYLAYHHKVPFGAYGKANDLLNLVSKHQGAQAYVFDLTRCKPTDFSLSDVYATLESIKNGMFVNLKYSTEMVLMDCPHVLVFANFVPDVRKLSADRWCVWRIQSDRSLVTVYGRSPTYQPS